MARGEMSTHQDFARLNTIPQPDDREPGGLMAVIDFPKAGGPAANDLRVAATERGDAEPGGLEYLATGVAGSALQDQVEIERFDPVHVRGIESIMMARM